MFLHADGLAAFEELACWRPLPVVELDDEAVLRHMRIAGYGMLDFIEASAVEAREALLGGDEARADAMSERAERARQDGEDRFWRLLDPDETDEGATGRSPGADREWAGGYFDVLPHVTEEAAALVDSDPAVAVGLGLVAGFVAGPERH